MRNFLVTFALVTIATLTASAFAQPPGFGRPKSPPVSPYLNLLNNRNSAAFNYYQLYRPQAEFRNAYQGLNQNVYQADRQLARQGESIEEISERVRPGATLQGTGHTTSFMNYGRYYQSGGFQSGIAAPPAR